MVLAPMHGYSGALYLARGSNNNYSNEPMSEVDLSSDGYPRYTVYEITDATKRYMNDDSTPTFASTGTIPTIARIEHCGGRVIFATPAGSGSDVITCATGHYLTVTEFVGVLDWQLSESWKEEAYMHLGDSCQSSALIHKQWEATANAHWMNTQATYTTSGGNANSHITLTHLPGGSIGDLVSITLVDPGTTNATIDVAVTGYDIVVTLAYATGAITTTATQLASALHCEAVLALGVSAAVKDGETGAGIVAELAHTHLAGGLDATDYSSETSKVVVVLYTDEANDKRYEGFGIIQKFNPNHDAGALIKTALTFRNHGPDPIRYRKG